MVSPITDSWIYATMLIENEWGDKGTGFLVARKIDDMHSRVFLATNKHVLHEEDARRRSADQVFLYLNIRNEDGSITGQRAELNLNLANGSKCWHEHPDRDVDVLAFDVTLLISRFPQIEKQWTIYSHFADQEKMEKWDVKMGDEVFVIGYPLGLLQGESNFPLLRSGIISTRIGETFQYDHPEPDGTTRRRIIRGFLIDRAAFPGSSGSPVVLKPTIDRFVKGKIIMRLPPAMLLGIVAETTYGPVQTPEGEIISYEGLGIAFDAETVRETIELFFQ